MTLRKKIAWLCTFSNAEKRSRLDLWREYLVEVGQWIPNLLGGLKNNPDYEFHIISTEPYLKRTIQSYELDGIHYHCFQSGFPIIGRPWPIQLPVDHLLGFPLNRHRIKKILKLIQPDLVHLFGAENPQYASGVLDLPPFMPWLVTIQGIVSREQHFNPNRHTKVRCLFENKILSTAKTFMGELDSREYLKDLNPDFDYTPFYFPVNESLIQNTPTPERIDFDILYAGAMTKQKGFEDFLELVRSLKATYPDFRAAVVGSVSGYPAAKDLLQKHQLEDNVVFLGRFPTQKELFAAYRRAKIFLAPTYNDCFPSTVRENMLLGIPVVAYATGGMKYVNTPELEVIRLIPQGDLTVLRQNVEKFLVSEDQRTLLAANAKQYAEEHFSLHKNCNLIVKTYQRMLNTP